MPYKTVSACRCLYPTSFHEVRLGLGDAPLAEMKRNAISEPGVYAMYPYSERMHPLVYILLVLCVGAIAATIIAIVTAGDGYQDESGFHAVRPTRPPTGRERESEEDTASPPLFPAH